MRRVLEDQDPESEWAHGDDRKTSTGGEAGVQTATGRGVLSRKSIGQDARADRKAEAGYEPDSSDHLTRNTRKYTVRRRDWPVVSA